MWDHFVAQARPVEPVARAVVRIYAIPVSWVVALLADRLSPVVVDRPGLPERAVDPPALELDSAVAARSQAVVALAGLPLWVVG